MTEDAFQQARKIMQQGNYLRGIITSRKGDVVKWTKIEDVHRMEGRERQADGAKKMLQKSLEKLDEARREFSILKFPDNDLIVKKNKKVPCENYCGNLIDEGEVFCKECLG
jgi:hypothetical protein